MMSRIDAQLFTTFSTEVGSFFTVYAMVDVICDAFFAGVMCWLLQTSKTEFKRFVVCLGLCYVIAQLKMARTARPLS
jgi:hypothetical protein